MSQEILRFTSHYSIFNQLAPFRSNSFLIYHRFLFLQAQFQKFFNFLFRTAHGSLSSNRVALNTQRILNISPIFVFASSNLKIFQIFPLVHRNRSSYQSAVCPHQTQQNHNITHNRTFARTLLKIFSIFPPETGIFSEKTTFFRRLAKNHGQCYIMCCQKGSLFHTICVRYYI